ncbi:MAG: radical SAM protein [Verrucomicrobiia bacterium]
MDPALHALGLPCSDEIQVQVFQNAICSWRCWYCFVDFDLLSANPRHSEFKTVEELIDLYLKEPNRPKIIDLSGGQPDLVPEWGLWFADALAARGLSKEIYLWSDDNLSNDYLWRHLESADLARLASYRNYGRVGCFKGFDEESFSFNTRAQPHLFDMQFKLMRRLVEAGFDVYGYTTFTSSSDKGLSNHMSIFIDRLQSEVHPLFPLRTVPLPILKFTPTRSRMGPQHERALLIQNDAVRAWTEELQRRFPKELRDRRIFQHRIN